MSVRRFLIVVALVLVPPAAAGTIHATLRPVFIQAAFNGIESVDCGTGFHVVTADLGDKVASSCQVVSRRLSVDSSTTPAGQHETAVEPADFAWGSTIVAAYQLGRFASGGASNIGFVVSQDGGRTWHRGVVPGLTVESSPAGTQQAASDPTVTYDAAHAVWLIGTLTLEQTGTRVMVARSPDGDHWSPPVTVASGPALDKEWITCDNGQTSRYRGRCYMLYTDDAKSEVVSQSSDDGGQTWSLPLRAAGLLVGVQPAVLGDGTLVVVAGSYNDTTLAGSIEGVRSSDGGATFTSITVSSFVAASAQPMRAISLPSLTLDASGKLYVAWSDCRFRPRCSANDIVFSASTDGLEWSSPQRIPLAPTTSTLSAFIPGLGADPRQSGRLGLVYAFFRPRSCATGACTLNVGFVQSPDGGASWTTPLRLNTVPMQMDWLPQSNGRMVGDYFATAFAGDRIVPVFALAVAPTNNRLHEAVFATSLTPIG